MKTIRYWLALVSALWALIASAVPAAPGYITVGQPDGTELQLQIRGDESFHYLLTPDGIPVIENPEGGYYYAFAHDDQLEMSEIPARNKDCRTSADNDFIAAHSDAASALIRKRLSNCGNATGRRSPIQYKLGQRTSWVGKFRGLVILVNFADQEFSIPNANESFRNQFNQRGYSENNHVGSMSDYFRDQSYGKFELEFDVVGPVTLAHDMKYYGANHPMTGGDLRAHEMIKEACQLADDKVDFSAYDWNGDGEAEIVYVVYAGYAESSGAPSYTIWPHQSNLNWYWANSVIFDDTVIGTYACSSELEGIKGITQRGIGTICHEFSHGLGLPDFYDTRNDGNGMGYWDLMGSGSYSGPNHNGEIPCGYSAYERWFAGWLDFTELTEMTRIEDMPSLEDKPVAYRISNDAHPDEYFTLENRQPGKWYSYVRKVPDCHGLMIYHVDYSESAWNNNTVNVDSSHLRMAYVAADNNYEIEQIPGAGYDELFESNVRGDIFPGSSGATEFTDDSHPGAGGKIFHANDEGKFRLGKPITNIHESDGLIGFDFMGGIPVDIPELLSLTRRAGNGLCVTWNPDSDLDGVDIEAEEVLAGRAIDMRRINESFPTLKSDVGVPDGTIDVSLRMDSHTSAPGWSGRNIFTSSKGAKIGKDDAAGILQTPLLNVESGSLTLRMTGVARQAGNLKFTLLNADGTEITVLTHAADVADNTFVMNFHNIDSKTCAVRIEPQSIFYVGSISAFDGDFLSSQITPEAILGSMFQKPEKRLMTNQPGNSYIFENLKGNRYKIRLRGVKDNARSEWSESKEVNLSGSGIDAVTDSDDSSDAEYFTISGLRIAPPSTPGIYILKKGDRVKKIIKR